MLSTDIHLCLIYSDHWIIKQLTQMKVKIKLFVQHDTDGCPVPQTRNIFDFEITSNSYSETVKKI
jgi:hypothetical protein